MLSVCGIAFHEAPAGQRGVFSFSDTQLVDAMVRLKRECRAGGVVVLATCDRLEAWGQDGRGDLFEPLCRALGIPVLAWKRYAYRFDDKEAVDYLFRLASGLESPLFGEDTIISQVEHASLLSRQCGSATAILQQLFRMASTAGKRVHRDLNLSKPEPFLPEAVARLIPPETHQILVIGSSATARLVAEDLLKRGYQVAMTLRDLRKNELVPDGVEALAYDERSSFIASYPMVVCATKGLDYAVDGSMRLAEGQLFIDLARPYDVDPALEGRVRIIREDELVYERVARKAALEGSRNLIETKKEEFLLWMTRSEQRKGVEALSERAAQDLLYRMHEPLKKLDAESRSAFSASLADTAYKSFLHELYEARGVERWVDLSHPLSSMKALYAGDPDIMVEDALTVERDGCAVKKISFGSHAGTHIDAPAHVIPGGRTLDQYPLERFVGKARVQRLSDEAGGRYPIVLFATGWSKKWGTKDYLTGHPVLTRGLCERLIESGVKVVGLDFPSPEAGDGLELHRLLLSHEVLVLENLCDLLPYVGRVLEVTIAPLPLSGADGAPCQVFAKYEISEKNT